MTLREYRTEYWAYAAWQRHAVTTANRDGWLRSGDRWFFRRGVYLGELDSAAGLFGAETKKGKLAFAGEPESLLPPEFESFPLLGRIVGSERIIASDFLGNAWRGPIFSVAYHCHGDTALAFRGFPQGTDSIKSWMRDWKGRTEGAYPGREWRFIGLDEFRRPMIFWVFSEGVMGFSGCFDPLLAGEYAEKMEKTKVFWHNP